MTNSTEYVKMENYKQNFQRLANILIKVQLPYPFKQTIKLVHLVGKMFLT